MPLKFRTNLVERIGKDQLAEFNPKLKNKQKHSKDLIMKLGKEEIKKQKNVISEDEFKKRLVEFRKEISKFQQDKQKVVNEFNQKKQIEFGEFFKKINPIIEE